MIEELTKIISSSRIYGALAMKWDQDFSTNLCGGWISYSQSQKQQYTKKCIIKMSNNSLETKIFVWENEIRFYICS